MRKKLLTTSLIAAMCLSLAACGDANSKDTPVSNTETVVTTEEVTETDTQTPTEELTTETPTEENTEEVTTEESKVEDTSSVQQIDSDKLVSMVENKDTFFLFVQGKDEFAKTYDIDYNAMVDKLNDIVKDYDYPFNLYYISEDDFDATDENIKKILGNTTDISEMLNYNIDAEQKAAEKRGETVEEKEKYESGLGDTYYGLYVFSNGELFNKETNIPLDAKEMKHSAIMLIYNDDFFVDTHDFDVVTYDDIKKKQENNETFLIYVGRDSCTYCHAFQEIIRDILDEKELNVPIYYFYSHSYKQNIEQGKDGAQETWDAVRDDLGFKKNASLIQFKDGESVGYFQFDEYFNADEYEDSNEQDREAQKNAAKEETIKYLEENDLLK